MTDTVLNRGHKVCLSFEFIAQNGLNWFLLTFSFCAHPACMTLTRRPEPAAYSRGTCCRGERVGARKAGNRGPDGCAGTKTPAAPPDTGLGVFCLITSQNGLCPGNCIAHRDTGIRTSETKMRQMKGHVLFLAKGPLQADQVFIVSCTFMVGILSSG